MCVCAVFVSIAIYHSSNQAACGLSEALAAQQPVPPWSNLAEHKRLCTHHALKEAAAYQHTSLSTI